MKIYLWALAAWAITWRSVVPPTSEAGIAASEPTSRLVIVEGVWVGQVGIESGGRVLGIVVHFYESN